MAENFALRPEGEGVVLKAEVPKSRTVESPNLKQVLLKKTKRIVSEDEVQVEGKVKASEVKKVGPHKDE